MCYCAGIKNMMKQSKERNESVTEELAGGTAFVKYYEEFDDYTLQYSWIISGDDSKTRSEVKELLVNYSNAEFVDDSNLDIIQIGLVSVYHTNEDQLCNIIELSKTHKLKSTRDTTYIFCGRKVLRIVQYCGTFSNQFDCIDSITKWNETISNEKIEDSIKIMKGIEYYHSKGTNTIVFSIGCELKKAIFTENIDEIIPPFLCIDSIQGVIEHRIKD